MIRISQLKLPLNHQSEDMEKKLVKELRIDSGQLRRIQIVKESIDARKKPEIWFSYTIDVELKGGAREEERLVKRLKNRNISLCREKAYQLPEPGTEPLAHPPVVIGTGPAGLFCGLILARMGYRPLILERGDEVEERTRKVESFWKGGPLDPSSNVQFGEGGAGTFSDGKLNTLVKDTYGRNHEVLKIFTEFGADPSICYVNKPHIGTDVLSRIVKSMRQEIERLGGQVRFRSQVTDVRIQNGRLTGLVVNGTEELPVSAAVLAIGHSARDTFEVLYKRGVPMEPKAFAVGLRIQHPQKMINERQYGMEEHLLLGPASYKVTRQVSTDRGVYSFCMCPGGYVVNASSEPGHLAVNGMSYQDRAGENANSALIITVKPEDFSRDFTAETGETDAVHPLAGVEFQRKLEKKAHELGGGKIPVQLYGDFSSNQATKAFGEVQPAFCGAYEFADLRQLLPEELNRSLIEAMGYFGTMIRGFDRSDSILAGVESRTSSPLRIPRDEKLESEILGLYPCGEGAGYAGGITSAAMDGIKVAEELIRRYRPFS